MSRHCPDCRAVLQPFWIGDVELDRCGSCSGLWFDWGELRELGGPEPEQPLAAALQRVGEFDCVGCGKRLPLTERNAVRDGLACDGCTPQVVPLSRLGASTRADGRSFLELLLWLLPL